LVHVENENEGSAERQAAIGCERNPRTRLLRRTQRSSSVGNFATRMLSTGTESVVGQVRQVGWSPKLLEVPSIADALRTKQETGGGKSRVGKVTFPRGMRVVLGLNRSQSQTPWGRGST